MYLYFKDFLLYTSTNSSWFELVWRQAYFLFTFQRWYTATAIPFIYSFSGNSAASAPISTFMCLWAIYIFAGSVYIFPPAVQADPSWEYIIHSQKHECGNWDWRPDIPVLGIFVSNFRHFVFAVHWEQYGSLKWNLISQHWTNINWKSETMLC